MTSLRPGPSSPSLVQVVTAGPSPVNLIPCLFSLFSVIIFSFHFCQISLPRLQFKYYHFIVTEPLKKPHLSLISLVVCLFDAIKLSTLCTWCPRWNITGACVSLCSSILYFIEMLPILQGPIYPSPKTSLLILSVKRNHSSFGPSIINEQKLLYSTVISIIISSSLIFCLSPPPPAPHHPPVKLAFPWQLRLCIPYSSSVVFLRQW